MADLDNDLQARKLPCGCDLKWNDKETRVIVCAFHQLQYVIWRGTDLEFIRRITTPSLNKLDNMEINNFIAQS